MISPLADRLRPKSLDDIVGQAHLLGKGKVLRRIVETGQIPNMIFYGPSGIGKTTLAGIIAQSTNKKLFKLNATTATTSDIKEIIAHSESVMGYDGVLLYLDEIQYFTKKQQQTLLEFIENGKITLIASTTENPYFYVYNAILSRSTIFEFKPIAPSDIVSAVKRGFSFLEEENNTTIEIEEGVYEYISFSCGGDVRKAMNTVELAFLSAQIKSNGEKMISVDDCKQLSQKSSMRYDRDSDEHYDILSAFQKSMRGSDVDASIHYLARLIEAGDLTSICRRLIVCCCEDVGLAYPQLIPIVKSCVDSALQVGFPEARIPLADGVILVATAPKSNSGISAIDSALADIKEGNIGDIPSPLKDSHYKGAKYLGHGTQYCFPHSFPNHWVKQQYLPEILKSRKYYNFGENKIEQTAKSYWEKIKGEK